MVVCGLTSEMLLNPTLYILGDILAFIYFFTKKKKKKKTRSEFNQMFSPCLSPRRYKSPSQAPPLIAITSGKNTVRKKYNKEMLNTVLEVMFDCGSCSGLRSDSLVVSC